MVHPSVLVKAQPIQNIKVASAGINRKALIRIKSIIRKELIRITAVMVIFRKRFKMMLELTKMSHFQIRCKTMSELEKCLIFKKCFWR